MQSFAPRSKTDNHASTSPVTTQLFRLGALPDACWTLVGCQEEH